jgi:large subunit ribosomal protein L21
MYAVIRTGSKQYKVEVGTTLDIEQISGDVGEAVTFDDVLLTGDAERAVVGQPTVKGAKVLAKIVAQHRGPKLIAFKKIRRQGKQLTKGHRQELTRVQVTEVVA